MMEEEKEFLTKGLKQAILVKNTPKFVPWPKSEDNSEAVTWYQKALVS